MCVGNGVGGWEQAVHCRFCSLSDQSCYWNLRAQIFTQLIVQFISITRIMDNPSLRRMGTIMYIGLGSYATDK